MMEYNDYELLALALGEHEEEWGIGDTDRAIIESQAPGLLEAIADCHLSYNWQGGIIAFTETHPETVALAATKVYRK